MILNVFDASHRAKQQKLGLDRYLSFIWVLIVSSKRFQLNFCTFWFGFYKSQSLDFYFHLSQERIVPSIGSDNLCVYLIRYPDIVT